MGYSPAIPQRDSNEHTALARKALSDYFFAGVVVCTTALLFILWKETVIHWFLLPLTACGILAGVDMVRWMRGHLDTYDPKGIVGCLIFYGFFLAPLLHVAWDRYGTGHDLTFLADWRPWLGGMAFLNAAGLGCYHLAHGFAHERARPSPIQWDIDRRRFYPIFATGIVLSLLGQLYFLAQLGGIAGIIESYESYRLAFAGKGWLLVFAWPFAILAFITITVWAKGKTQKRKSSLFTIGLLLSAAAGVHFLLMGWRGSRSATVWGLFWMAGIVHYRFRKLSPKLVTAGLVLLLAFMYFYAFYKEQGRAGFAVLKTPELWWDPVGYQRDFKGMLLGDLARADVNAYILHNLITYPKEYDYRWGLTYLGGLAVLIPRNVWPDRPRIRVQAGTEALLGPGARWRSSRVYGLGGEAMLNFGPLGIPPLFALYGGLMGWYRRKLTTWGILDSRILLAPLFALLLIGGIISDSDNLVFAAVTQGALICACIFAASRPHSLTSRKSQT